MVHQRAALIRSNAGAAAGSLLEGAEMEKPTQMEIVRRAYQLWQQAGEPQGKDEEFYYLAEQQLRNEDKSSPLRTPTISNE